MRQLPILCISFLMLTSCSGSGGQGDSGSGSVKHLTAAPEPSNLVSGPNTMVIKVSDPTLCGGNSYANQLCTSITICAPGTSSCQTIPNILVDTGSYGLRLFSSIVNLNLSPVTADGTETGNPLAECAQFGSGNDWGSVVYADVVLGEEPAVKVPIQLIDSSFAGGPPTGICASPDTDATSAGFNGILGLGLFPQDCGTTCETSAAAGFYYSCQGHSCSGVMVPAGNQVTNPVSALPVDNNGVIIVLQPVPDGGYESMTGQMILGIGTQANNQASGVTPYFADTQGNFTTSFNNKSFVDASFLDSGSNGIFFAPTADTALCGAAAGFYCPGSALNYSATIRGVGFSTHATINFSIESAETLFQSGNTVFSNLGGEWDPIFDWGLPFFFGRTVYVGISGKNSSLGTGPYWAF